MISFQYHRLKNEKKKKNIKHIQREMWSFHCHAILVVVIVVVAVVMLRRKITKRNENERRNTYTSTCYIVVSSMDYEHNNISYLQPRFTPLHRMCRAHIVWLRNSESDWESLPFSSDSTCQRSTVKIAIAFSRWNKLRERKKWK